MNMGILASDVAYLIVSQLLVKAFTNGSASDNNYHWVMDCTTGLNTSD